MQVTNTVGHIFSSKAVSRAVKGHCIVDASLHPLLAAKVIGVTLPAENTDPDLSMESEDVAALALMMLQKMQSQLAQKLLKVIMSKT